MGFCGSAERFKLSSSLLFSLCFLYLPTRAADDRLALCPLTVA